MKILEAKETVIALAGNPNSGKSSLFNALTGSRQHVGNWPGVTVEKKEGRFSYRGLTFRVVDLPGTYSLGAHTEDEIIARDFLFSHPDIVVNVVDSTNLERNLYLTLQLLEMGASLVLVLNMSDEAKAKHIEIDQGRLSTLLGTPVVMTVAPRKEGIPELLERIVTLRGREPRETFRIKYREDIEEEIAKIEALLTLYPELTHRYPSRWLAIKLLEGEKRILQEMNRQSFMKHVFPQVEESKKRLIDRYGEDLETIFANQRYHFITRLVQECMRRKGEEKGTYTLSDRIDRVVTHRFFGIPLFLFTMWLVFQCTFALSEPLVGWIETLFTFLQEKATFILENLGVADFFISFLVDGVINGVGSVLVFVPPIFLLFLAISLLEDSGYIARAAYVMDRLMHILGLHGKSFIPLLLGFGCNVPGIMATRTLENREDRMITMLVNPFISCAARLPVYVLFTGVFFARHQGWIIFSLYLLGIVVAILTAKWFKRYLFKGETSHFVMELPPYRIPTVKGLFIHMWERGSSFIKKAGTIIIAMVVLIWILANLPFGVEYASNESIIGKLGTAMAPLLAPAGFGTWQTAVSLIFGIVAKEVVVGTLAVVYGVGEEGVGEMVRQHFTPLSAYAFMVMTLLYIPCVATIGAIRRESNSWGITIFALGYSLIVGWTMAVLIFQVGQLLGFH